MTYSLWCFGPQVGGSPSSLMIITIPLVLLGIFRYQMLGENSQKKIYNQFTYKLESPEKF